MIGRGGCHSQDPKGRPEFVPVWCGCITRARVATEDSNWHTAAHASSRSKTDHSAGGLRPSKRLYFPVPYQVSRVCQKDNINISFNVLQARVHKSLGHKVLSGG